MLMKRNPTSTTTLGDPRASNVEAATIPAALVGTTPTAPRVATTLTVVRATTLTVLELENLIALVPTTLTVLVLENLIALVPTTQTAQVVTMERIIRAHILRSV